MKCLIQHLVEVPLGWMLQGDIRPAKKGEYFLRPDGRVVRQCVDNPDVFRIILLPVNKQLEEEWLKRPGLQGAKHDTQNSRHASSQEKLHGSEMSCA